jgi:hypothetical protein
MGSTFGLRMPPGGNSKDFFAEMPSGMKSFVSSGFEILRKIPADKLEELKRQILRFIETGGISRHESGGAEALGLTLDDAESVVSAMSLFSTLILNSNETADQVVASGVEAQIIPESSRVAGRNFLAFIRENRTEMNREIREVALSRLVFPALTSLDSAVDFRLAFEKGRISHGTPVALIHIDTDMEGRELSVQMNKHQLAKLIKDLEELLRRMEDAEKWAASRKE